MADPSKLLPYDPKYETKDQSAVKRLDDYLIRTPGKLQEYLRPRGPNDKIHNRDEPEEGPHYNRGGAVKHGSDTCIVCKNKFG